MFTVNFRPYLQADFDDLSAMVIGLYSKDGSKATNMTVDKVALTVEKMASPQATGQITVFETTVGEIIGYAILNRFWSNEFSGQILYLDELFVKPLFRSHGVGALFFQYLEQILEKDFVAFMLETVPDNEKAIKFYRKAGFEAHHNHLMFKQLA